MARKRNNKAPVETNTDAGNTAENSEVSTVESMGEVGGVEQFTTTDGIENAEVVEEQDVSDSTDPTLPMGENGNELVDDLNAIADEEPAMTEEELHDWNTIDTSSDGGTEELAATEETVEPQATEDEVEILAATLDAYEGESDGEYMEEQEDDGESGAEPNSFSELLDGVPQEAVDSMVHLIARCIDDRADFERQKSESTGKDNIQSTLKKARQSMVTKAAARVMLAANVGPGFINRVKHEGSRYNVYAIGKIADFIKGLAGTGSIDNAVNLAIMRSLFKFRAAGVQFTGELAKAAVSDKIRVEGAVRNHLVRHTVSASTASTQASSTMQALETLGVVVNKGNTKNAIYELVDNPVTRQIEELLAA